jgi:hypothetical protein
LLGCCGRKGIQPLAARPLNQSVLRVPILYKKEIRMKFKKNIVIRCNAMYENEILFREMNMKDIMKLHITNRGMNCRMTIVSNVHTCTIGVMNLICAIIFFMERQLLKLPRDVISGTRVSVPDVVDGVGVHCSRHMSLF